MPRTAESGSKSPEIGQFRSARPGTHMYYSAWEDHQPQQIGKLPISVTGKIVGKNIYTVGQEAHISYCLQLNNDALNQFGLPSQFWVVLSRKGGWLGEYDDQQKQPALRQRTLW